jgi:hypothetical protein
MRERVRLVTIHSLADRALWVAWQTEERHNRDGSVKRTKVPYDPANGRMAKSNDASTWSTRKAAEARASTLPRPFGLSGPGICLGALDDEVGLGGVDWDSCRTPAGAFADWAIEGMARIASYSEISPSGTGAKTFFRYWRSDEAVLRKALGGKLGRKWTAGAGEHPPSIELYIAARYFAVTDERLDEYPVALNIVDLDDLLWIIEVAGPALSASSSSARANGHDRSAGGERARSRDQSRSGDAFHVACAMKRAGKSFEDYRAAMQSGDVTDLGVELANTIADLVEWAADERQLERAWENAEDDDDLAGFSEAERALIAELAGLSEVLYDRRRQKAADHLGLRVKTLDDLVERLRARSARPEETAEQDATLERMNGEYFISQESGKTLVYAFRKHPTLDRMVLHRSSFQNIRDAFCNQFVRDGKEAVDLGSWWLAHAERRQYLAGIVFRPGKPARDGEFNLWTGFAVEPKAGDWSLLKDHTLKIVCGGDKAVFDHLLKLMAMAVQRPWERWEIAVVLRGGEGVGKGILLRFFGSLFGRHFQHITKVEHIVGRFNTLLQDCVVMFADECFFAGNREHGRILKGLITEPEHQIEPKGVDPYPVACYVHPMLASNNEWVVPASHDARRYFVLDVADDRAGDFAYFAAIDAQMKAGGRAAMLDELTTIDLTGFNPRAFPKTAALTAQKRRTIAESQDPDELLEDWWLTILENGELPPELEWDKYGRPVGERKEDPTPRRLRWRSTRDLHEAAREHHERLRNVAKDRVSKFLATPLVGARTSRPGIDDNARGWDFDSKEDHRSRWITTRSYSGTWSEGNWDAAAEPKKGRKGLFPEEEDQPEPSSTSPRWRGGSERWKDKKRWGSR